MARNFEGYADLRNKGDGWWNYQENLLGDFFGDLIGTDGMMVYVAFTRLIPRAISDPEYDVTLLRLSDYSQVSVSQVRRVKADLVALGMVIEFRGSARRPSTYQLPSLRELAQLGLRALVDRLPEESFWRVIERQTKRWEEDERRKKRRRVGVPPRHTNKSGQAGDDREDVYLEASEEASSGRERTHTGVSDAVEQVNAHKASGEVGMPPRHTKASHSEPSLVAMILAPIRELVCQGNAPECHTEPLECRGSAPENHRMAFQPVAIRKEEEDEVEVKTPLPPSARGECDPSFASASQPAADGVVAQLMGSPKIQDRTDPWALILAELKRTMDRHSYETWLQPTRLRQIDGLTLIVQLPCEEFVDVCERHEESILAAMRGLGMPYGVQFYWDSDPEEATTPAAPVTAQEPLMTVSAAVSALMRGAGVSDPRTAKQLERAVSMATSSGKTPGQAASQMLDAWKRYLETRDRSAQHPYGVVKFFTRGIWNTPELWGIRTARRL
jgi:hypothetical protein